jgi:hypothetical protein
MKRSFLRASRFMSITQRDSIFGSWKTVHPIRMDGKALGVLPMSRGFALILACGASLFSFGVQASPIHFAPMQKAASDIILVWDWCGLGFHRSPYGYCVRNGILPAPPVVVAPSPVIAAPSPVVVPTVVAPIVCPSGYYLGPYGRCLLY